MMTSPHHDRTRAFLSILTAGPEAAETS
jgi:hypothetical protein